MTQLKVLDSAPATVKGSVLVLGSNPGDEGAHVAAGPALPKQAVKHLNAALEALEAKGSQGEVLRLTHVPNVAAPLVVLTGLGSAPKNRGSEGLDTSERLRRAAGAAARTLAGHSDATFAIGDGSGEQVAAVAEGALLGAYSFQTFHGKDKAESSKSPVETVSVWGMKPRSRDAKSLVERVTTVCDAVRYARDLVNTPPNVLFPESFAASVAQRVKGTKVSIDVWDMDKLAKEGCGGIVGVGQGSGRDPRLVTMHYKPLRAKAHIALVGKGITFDSGGLCLKPGASMATMKLDMAGAATVAAAVRAIADLGLPVEVTGYLCLAENMTGDLAQRPGDVVTMRGGTTVEIINTDAEGRLVMADGLALASERKPDAVVDIATLTGAQTIALGERTTGVMGNDEELRERTHQAASVAGDTSWPMPLPEELRATLDSNVADIKHVGGRAGGMMVAATFLQEFVGNGADGLPLPWAHLDIAGPAFNEQSAYGYTPTGATGAGVRTLIALAESYAK